jgi:hypothetical protein
MGVVAGDLLQPRLSNHAQKQNGILSRRLPELTIQAPEELDVQVQRRL